MENLHQSLPQVLVTGQWFTAAGDGKVAHVSREDCARAAAAALASTSTEKAIYNITGAAAQSTVEIASLASKILGKPIAVVQVPADHLAKGLAAAGVPDFLVPLLVAFDVNTALGRVAEVSDDFNALTGKTPLTLREFLEVNKAAFGR